MTSLDRFQITTSRSGTNELRCAHHPDQLLAVWHDTMPLPQILKFAFGHNLEHHRDTAEQWYLPVNSALAELLNAIGTPPLNEQQVRHDVAAAQDDEAAGCEGKHVYTITDQDGKTHARTEGGPHIAWVLWQNGRPKTRDITAAHHDGEVCPAATRKVRALMHDDGPR